MRRDWKEDARVAIGELQHVGHGEREREMQAIARRLGGHKDASGLRRAIFAYEFLSRLCTESPDVYEILLRAPLTIVEVIARWHAFDPFKALSVARDWGKGIGTVRSIAADMQTARSPGFMGKTGGVFAKAYLTAAEPVVVDAVRGLTVAQLPSLEREIKDSTSGHVIDFLFSSFSETGEKQEDLAVLVVGPYNNKKAYANRCSSWVTRAFGLAWLYDTVVLALPEKAALEEYRQRASKVTAKARERSNGADAADPRLRTGAPSVEVVHIDVDPFTPVEHAALAKLK